MIQQNESSFPAHDTGGTALLHLVAKSSERQGLQGHHGGERERRWRSYVLSEGPGLEAAYVTSAYTH